MRCPAYSSISVDFFKVPVIPYFNLKLTAQICHVLNPGEDGVRRPVKRRVQTRVIFIQIAHVSTTCADTHALDVYRLVSFFSLAIAL